MRPAASVPDCRSLDAEQAAHPRVCVVRVGGVGDPATGVQFARNVQDLEIRYRPAAGQVAQVGAEAERRRQVGDDLLLHLRRDLAAVERVVVRVDEHRGDVTRHRDRVRRLQHLPGVVRVEIRVVVAHPLGELGEGGCEPLFVDPQRLMRLKWRVLRLPALDRLGGLHQPGNQIHWLAR